MSLLGTDFLLSGQGAIIPRAGNIIFPVWELVASSILAGRETASC